MIEKFNFYDIYGYFLPGLAFLGVLWLPFALVGHAVPPSGWSSAIVVGAAAYILGHLLQMVATSDLPSKIKDSQGKPRFPSEIALDRDSELPAELREKIGSIAKDQFGLDVRANAASDDETDKRRNAAFLFARQVLILGKAISYAEQFQGMYALMRGLSVIFVLGFSYWLGWAASTQRHRILVWCGVLGLTVTLLLLINVSVQLVFANRQVLKQQRKWVYVLMFFMIGYVVGLHYEVTVAHGAELSLLAGLALLASLRTYSAYRYFAGRFAITIWRDFLAFNARVADASTSGNKVPNGT